MGLRDTQWNLKPRHDWSPGRFARRGSFRHTPARLEPPREDAVALFDYRRALVTGASSGLGAAVVTRAGAPTPDPEIHRPREPS